MPDQRSAAAPAPSAEPDAADRAAFDAHRMDALGYLAGGVSHDLANPLSAMLAFASFIANDPRLPADLRDDAKLLRAEADKTHRMVHSLLEFARSRPPALTAIDVDAVLAEILELEDYLLAGVDVERDIPGGLPPVEADPSRLRHLLMVLSVEALRRLGERPLTGRFRIAAAAAAGGRLEVTYAWTRGAGRTGVVGGAVPSAEALATALGAALTEEDADDGGRIVVSLPGSLAPGAGAEVDARTTADASATHGGVPTVLVCDDEASIRSLLVRLLERAGFRAVPAATATEALGVIGEGGVDVVLTDHLMRGMSGMDLFLAATAQRPELRRRFVLMTGDASAADLVRFADEHGLPILQKPFDMSSVGELIREVARA